MNRQDEFWFYLSKAITEPKKSNSFFYYKKSTDEIFGIRMIGTEMLPLYRNTTTKANKDIEQAFSENILGLKTNVSDFILLTRLTLEEKRAFLFQFIGEITDDNLKKRLLLEAERIDDNDEFDFKIDLKLFNKTVAYNFDLHRGIYIINKIKEYYFPLGILENTHILW